MILQPIKKFREYKKTLKGLSLERRLPLFISILLLIVILTFSVASYFGIQKVSLEAGKKRLLSVTDELSIMFTQSSQALHAIMLDAAGRDTIRKFTQTGRQDLRAEALVILQKLHRDSSWALIELFDSARAPLLSYGDANVVKKIPANTIFASSATGPRECKVGKLVASSDSLFYAIVASVTEKNRVAGYLVCWRSMASNPKGVQQLSQLMGTGSTLYVGNADGSLWTNLIKTVPPPPINPKLTQTIFEYTDAQGIPVLAAVQPIATTSWLVLVEFHKKDVLAAADDFLKWIIIFGGTIIVLGIFVTWLMSRNITRPLYQLTKAASAIALGNYSAPVNIRRKDELGTLADTFNVMAEQLRTTQSELENKVAQRTAQLEAANTELESFAYSISHDLRAPLRSIVGFSSIIEEEYDGKLDGEGKRLLSIIKSNTLKMGNLIDDLLAFSRLGRNEIVKAPIDTGQMVLDVINSLDAKDNTQWDVHSLPYIQGDANSIRQVWVNLLSNAIKYSRNSGQPHIEVGVNLQNGEPAVFFVKDNGIGFKQQYESKLFKVFQRLHNANEFEGTGVGLAIVEKIISKHGGAIWVKAEENKGACFFFTIPS